MAIKKVLILLILNILYINAFSQQQTLQSLYMTENIYINPALAGINDEFPVTLSVRTQWIGIENYPKTQILSANKSIDINKQMGVGGIIYNDIVGFERRTGVSGVYSYKVSLGEKYKLSIGLSLSLYQYSVNEANYKIVDIKDPVFTSNRENVVLPDAGTGIYFYSKKMFIGYSITQLFQNKINISGTVKDLKMLQHHYFMIGKNIEFNKNLKMSSYEIIRIVNKIGLPYTQFETNLTLTIRNKYWFGASYRSKNMMIFMFGFNFEKYKFGSAYSLTNGSLPNSKSNSLEIFIKADLYKVFKNQSN